MHSLLSVLCRHGTSEDKERTLVVKIGVCPRGGTCTLIIADSQMHLTLLMHFLYITSFNYLFQQLHPVQLSYLNSLYHSYKTWGVQWRTSNQFVETCQQQHTCTRQAFMAYPVKWAHEWVLAFTYSRHLPSLARTGDNSHPERLTTKRTRSMRPWHLS